MKVAIGHLLANVREDLSISLDYVRPTANFLFSRRRLPPLAFPNAAAAILAHVLHVLHERIG